MAVAYTFYFLNINSADEIIVATVNGNDLTRDELDWWYKVSILPEFRDTLTKKDFMILSLIPQEVLVQEAKKQNIKVSNDDIEKLLGLYIIENGFTLDEFADQLSSRDLTIDDIKRSFETRAYINMLFEQESVVIEEGTFFENGISMEVYVDVLIESSDIKIYPENIDKLALKSFEETGDEICNENKIEIRLFTTSTCELCKESGELFKTVTNEYAKESKINAVHWSLDEGDNLLTSKKENGVPNDEIAIFKKYSPNKLVPSLILGCKYKKIGKFSSEDEFEFKAILKQLLGG